MHLVLRAGSSRWRAPIAVAARRRRHVRSSPRARSAPPAPARSPPTGRYLVTPLTSAYSIQEVLLAATPLLLTGLAVAIAFRAGYYNIGAEGQFLAGAIGATVPGLYARRARRRGSPCRWPWRRRRGRAAVGAAAGVAQARRRHRRGGHDAAAQPGRRCCCCRACSTGRGAIPRAGSPTRRRSGRATSCRRSFGSDRVHAGLLIAVVLIAATGVVMALTPLGLRLKAAGQAPDAARFSGIAVARLQLLGGARVGGDRRARRRLPGARRAAPAHRLDRRRLRLHRHRRRLAGRAHRRRRAARRPAARRHRRRRPERLARAADPAADGRDRHRRAAAHRRVVPRAAPLSGVVWQATHDRHLLGRGARRRC